MAFGSARSLGAALAGEATPGRVVERACAAERAGLDSLWFIEDYFQTGAFALAGAAAAVTRRIGLGLGVVNPYTRHPALLAMETATLAGIAPGRVVLGLGTGVRHWVEGQMAIPAARPLAALAECVDVVRRLWAGERVSHEGRAFSLRDVALEFKPPQPTLPIVLGVKGPRALALAGAVADGVVCSIMSSPAHVRRVRATVAAARRDVGYPGPFPILAYVPVAIGPDAAAARRAVRPLLARYLDHLHGQPILADAGVAAAESLAIRAARASGESGASLVTDTHVDTFALAGTPDQVRRRLGAWIEAGLDTPIVLPAGEMDPVDQFELIGAELGPWLRSGR
jgi:5,10-methylenetetrahydromethanopterin reductase